MCGSDHVGVYNAAIRPKVLITEYVMRETSHLHQCQCTRPGFVLSEGVSGSGSTDFGYRWHTALRLQPSCRCRRGFGHSFQGLGCRSSHKIQNKTAVWKLYMIELTEKSPVLLLYTQNDPKYKYPKPNKIPRFYFGVATRGKVREEARLWVHGDCHPILNAGPVPPTAY